MYNIFINMYIMYPMYSTYNMYIMYSMYGIYICTYVYTYNIYMYASIICV